MAWVLRRVVLPFTSHIYDSWIISSYHLYLNGLDKYHQLSKQALSGNKQDPLRCDLLYQALTFLEKQIRQIIVSLHDSIDYICHYLILFVRVLLNYIQKCLGKDQWVQVERKFQNCKTKLSETKWTLKYKLWGINVREKYCQIFKT